MEKKKTERDILNRNTDGERATEERQSKKEGETRLTKREGKEQRKEKQRYIKGERG